MINHNINDRATLELIANAAHEINRIYCLSEGDKTQLHWEDAPQWQKDSAINGVMIALKGATPEEIHKSWMNEKLANGWTFGPTKDIENKKHPCLVDYTELSDFQRCKDFLYISTVRLMALALNLIIEEKF